MQALVWYLICFLTSTISISQAIQCPGSARYKLTFKGLWTSASHPQDFPKKNPHFSSVVGCSHNASYVMWRPGVNATKGVQVVAESGSPTTINNEMDTQISLKTAFDKFQGGVITNVQTSVVSDIEVNTDYPLVSAISMIAPSPDWFVGVRDYSLCNDTTGKWIDKSVKDLPLYDAGTDSAKSFVHIDTPTSPPVPVFLITSIPEGSASNETLKRFGTFTFEKTFDSTEVSTSKVKSTMSPSMSVKPTMKSSPPKTTNSAESSVVHLGVFVFLKLMILNMFFV